MSQYLIFVVDDVIFIKGRGLGLTPGTFGIGEAMAGDIVEIRSASGSIITTRIKSIEWQRRFDHHPAAVGMGEPGLVLTALSKGDVSRGDEVWSVESQTSKVD